MKCENRFLPNASFAVTLFFTGTGLFQFCIAVLVSLTSITHCALNSKLLLSAFIKRKIAYGATNALYRQK